MGIPYGYELTKNCGQIIDISKLSDEIIAIDMMTYVIRYFKNTKSKLNWHEKVLLFLKKFLNNNNKLICVFDGKNKPKEKHLCLLERKRKQNYYNHINLSKLDLDELIIKIKELGCTVYLADGEGESLCCYLLKENLVTNILSEDRDVIMYQASNFLMKYDGVKCIKFSLEEILTKRVLTFDQLFCLCLSLGCDYNFERQRKTFKTAIENKDLLVEDNFEEYKRMKELYTPSGIYISI